MKNIMDLTISQNKENCDILETMKIRSLFLLSILGIILLFILGLEFPINIVSVILFYPIYYWLSKYYYTNNKIIYCDNCNKIILWGIRLDKNEYCGKCAYELERRFNSTEYINFVKISYDLEKTKTMIENSNSKSRLQ